jgi:acylpyruvate hydrolase
MKIICIGRNYRDHAKELNNPVPTKPLVFMKPPSALLIKNKPMYIPDFTKNLHYEAEIVLKICKNGKYVQPAFAKKYFKAKGHPWEIAKAFDNSAALSEFISLGNVNQEEGIKFQMKKNGEVVQDGNTKDLIFDFNFLICYVSKFFKLQMGDMIFTGTPAGVGPVEIGDHLEGFVDGEKLMDCQIR